MRLFGVGLVSVHASLDRRSEEEEEELFVSYGNAVRQMQALINYMVHLHIPVVRHYVNTDNLHNGVLLLSQFPS